jgi:serine/threonine protein kinase
VNVGSHIGQYRILRKIGAGGMGTVYLGEHILLGRKAAIKTLLPSLSVHPEIVERFFTEARATSAITDHGVVQIFDFGYHVDGTAYIVMELLEGESLQTRIDRLGKLAASEALRIARQVSGSLVAAHACEIIHRDLKPENIYLIADGEAQGGERTKILDFGICKLGTESGDASLTQSGTTMGTPVYMSPEQCRGAGKVDPRSDVYALGCVLFHMVAGRPPFEREGAGEFIVAHLQEEPPAPSTFVDGGLPELVDGLILRCLEKSPDDRFQTMTELQHALEYVLARISSTTIAIPVVLPRMPIAAGFRSSYDLNAGTPIPTHAYASPGGEPSVLVTAGGTKQAKRRKSNSSKSSSTPPLPRAARGSQPQALQTSAGTPKSVRAASSSAVARAQADARPSGGEWFVEKPRSRAAAAIVLFGLAAALIATWVMTSGDDAIASSQPIEISPIMAPAAAPVAAEPGPSKTVAVEPVADVTLDHREAAAASKAAAKKAADAARPTRNVRAKARRPSITVSKPRSAPATAPAEDLYDTR